MTRSKRQSSLDRLARCIRDAERAPSPLVSRTGFVPGDSSWSLVGRRKHLDEVQARLTAGCRLLKVRGPMGIGKSTFLRMLQADSEIRNIFAGRITRCPDALERDLAQARLAQQTHDSATMVRHSERIERHVRGFGGAPFLFLMDDVWLGDVPGIDAFYAICRAVFGSKGSIVVVRAPTSDGADKHPSFWRRDPDRDIELGRLTDVESHDLLRYNSPPEADIDRGGPVAGFVSEVISRCEGNPTLLVGVVERLREGHSGRVPPTTSAEEVLIDLDRDPRDVNDQCRTFFSRLVERAIALGLSQSLCALSWFEPGEPRRPDLESLVNRPRVDAMVGARVCSLGRKQELVLNQHIRQALIQHFHATSARADAQAYDERRRQFARCHDLLVELLFAPGDSRWAELGRLSGTCRRILWWLARTTDLKDAPPLLEEHEESSPRRSASDGLEDVLMNGANIWARRTWVILTRDGLDSRQSRGRLEQRLASVLPGPERILSVRECMVFWEALYETCPPTPPTIELLVQLHLGRAFIRGHRYREGAAHLTTAVGGLDGSREKTGVIGSEPVLHALSKALRLIADVRRDEMAFDDAIQALERAKALHAGLDQSEEHRSSLIKVYRKFAKVHQARGALDQAAASMDEANKLYRRWDDQTDRAYSHCVHGIILRTLGQFTAALRMLDDAVRLHIEALGAQWNGYLGYDLNRKASILVLIGRPYEALACAKRALKLHERINSPDSPHAAIDHVRLAEIWLALRDPEKASRHIDSALKFYGRTASSRLAFAHTVEARIQAAMGDESEARKALEAALRLHTAKDPGLHYIEFQATRAELELHWDKPEAARAALRCIDVANGGAGWMAAPKEAPAWQLHRAVSDELALSTGPRPTFDAWQNLADRYARLGRAQSADRVENLVLHNSAESAMSIWGDSVDAYDRYLDDHPHCLHHRLAARVVDELQTCGVRNGWVLDFGSGTGLLGQHLTQATSGLSLLGIDIGPFVARARTRDIGAPHCERVYLSLEGDWAAEARRTLQSRNGRLAAITLNMVLFQLSPAERAAVLRRLASLAQPGTVLLITTHAADFKFGDTEADGDNPWKGRIFALMKRELNDAGARTYAESIQPVQAKDTLDTIKSLLAHSGFALMGRGSPDAFEVERPAADRLQFSRIPAIERKIFGRRMEARFWKILATRLSEQAPDYHDTTWGVCLMALAVEVDPSVTIDVDDRVKGKHLPMKSAAAVVLRDRKDRVLLAQRGARREFPGFWSLPSTYQAEGELLVESMRRALAQRLDIRVGDLRLVGRRLNAREDWRILMHLFEACFDGEPVLDPDKYVDSKWVDERVYLQNDLSRTPDAEQGDCMLAWKTLVAERSTRSTEP